MLSILNDTTQRHSQPPAAENGKQPQHQRQQTRTARPVALRSRTRGWEDLLVCLCVHLNLREPDRLKQYRAISDYVDRHINLTAP